MQVPEVAAAVLPHLFASAPDGNASVMVVCDDEGRPRRWIAVDIGTGKVVHTSEPQGKGDGGLAVQRNNGGK